MAGRAEGCSYREVAAVKWQEVGRDRKSSFAAIEVTVEIDKQQMLKPLGKSLKIVTPQFTARHLQLGS